MMNSFAPVNAQSTYLPIEFQFPEDEKIAREVISERERLTASLLNVKEDGRYEIQETLNGQQWFSMEVAGDPTRTRYVYRTVINFGALPNASTKVFSHNIDITGTTIFTRIYGVATNSDTKFVPIPYVNVGTPTDGIELFIDVTNVNIITTTANWVLFNAYVVCEYIKA